MQKIIFKERQNEIDMNKRHSLDMTSGSVPKMLIRFVIPLLVTNLLQQFYTAADSAVVGRFAGKTALAAVGATGYATGLILNLVIGLSLGANIINANLLGSKQTEALRRSMHCSLLVALICGILVSAVGIMITPSIMEWTNCPESVIQDAILYMRIILCGAPGTMIYNFGAGILRTHGDSKSPMYIMASCGIINVLLNLVFVVYFKMTVAGVALATIISKYLSAATVLLILFNPNGIYKLKLRELQLPQNETWDIIRIGFPCAINSIVFSLSNTIVQYGVNGLGDAVVAGSTACSNISGLLYQVFHAFYTACVSFSGQCYGAGKYKRIDRLALWSGGLSASFVVIASIIISFIPHIFIGFFNSDPEVIRAGSEKLIIICWSYVAYAITETLMGCLRGMRQTAIPSVINIFSVCLIRVFWILALVPLFPGDRLFLFSCYPVSYVISLTAILVFYLHTRQQINRKQIATL